MRIYTLALSSFLVATSAVNLPIFELSPSTLKASDIEQVTNKNRTNCDDHKGGERCMPRGSGRIAPNFWERQLLAESTQDDCNKKPSDEACQRGSGRFAAAGQIFIELKDACDSTPQEDACQRGSGRLEANAKDACNSQPNSDACQRGSGRLEA